MFAKNPQNDPFCGYTPEFGSGMAVLLQLMPYVLPI